MVRVKGRRETRDAEQNKDKIVESTKEEQVRVKGRRETRDMITGKAEVLETKKEQRIRALDRDATPVDVEPSALQKEEKVRVKGRRETRDMVLKDRTNTGKQSLSQVSQKHTCTYKGDLKERHMVIISSFHYSHYFTDYFLMGM